MHDSLFGFRYQLSRSSFALPSLFGESFAFAKASVIPFVFGEGRPVAGGGAEQRRHSQDRRRHARQSCPRRHRSHSADKRWRNRCWSPLASAMLRIEAISPLSKSRQSGGSAAPLSVRVT